MPDASSSPSAAPTRSLDGAAPAAAPSRPHLDPAVAAVVALFDGPLAEQRFPGVDREALGELEAAVLQARAETEEARYALVRAQQVLVAREQTLVGHEATLLARAHRAMSYARIYAEDAPEVASSVRAIELPPLPVRAEPLADRPEPRRRGRPATRRIGAAREGAPLFEGPSNDTTSSAGGAAVTEGEGEGAADAG